jgi:hypothetical protein
LSNSLGNDTTVTVDNAIADTESRMNLAVFTGAFCKELVTSSRLYNVTNLVTPVGVRDIGQVCETTKIPVYNTLFIAGTRTQPTSRPSDGPSKAPTKPPTYVKPEVMTTSVIGFVAVVILIFFLRFFPYIMSLFFEQPKKPIGHRYDVLVMIDNSHDAILENINHEDIAFFRRTEIKEKDQKIAWIINNTPIALEKRSEVKFFDKYELLNNGIKGEKDKKIEDDAHTKPLNDVQVRQKSMLFDKVPMQKGMIVRVRLKDEKPSKDNRPYSSEFHDLSGKRPDKSCPTDHVISKFVIDNGPLKERIKLASLEKYRLESPRAEAQGLGAVSIDMSEENNDVLPFDSKGSSREYDFGDEEEDDLRSITSSDQYDFEDEVNPYEKKEVYDFKDDIYKKKEAYDFNNDSSTKKEENWEYKKKEVYDFENEINPYEKKEGYEFKDSEDVYDAEDEINTYKKKEVYDFKDSEDVYDAENEINTYKKKEVYDFKDSEDAYDAEYEINPYKEKEENWEFPSEEDRGW